MQNIFYYVFKLVEYILASKPGLEHIINEYNQTKSLVNETRKNMVNILAGKLIIRKNNSGLNVRRSLLFLQHITNTLAKRNLCQRNCYLISLPQLPVLQKRV